MCPGEACIHHTSIGCCVCRNRQGEYWSLVLSNLAPVVIGALNAFVLCRRFQTYHGSEAQVIQFIILSGKIKVNKGIAIACVIQI